MAPLRYVLVGCVAAMVMGGCSLVFGTDVLTSDNSAGGSPSLPEDGSTEVSPAPPITDGSAGEDAAPPPPSSWATGSFFFDDFTRPSSPAIGNRWTEKTEAAWEIADNRAVKVGSGVGYKDNVVFRAERMIANVEIIEELVAAKVPTRSTSLHARIQPGTVLDANTLDSYCVYILEDESLVIGRQRGSAAPAATLRQVGFEPRLGLGETYRLKLETVDGDGKVAIAATLERRTGPGAYALVVATAADDTASDRLGPGFVGFSADVNADRSIALVRFEARAK